jgi:hypothetical protein
VKSRRYKFAMRTLNNLRRRSGVNSNAPHFRNHFLHPVWCSNRLLALLQGASHSHLGLAFRDEFHDSAIEQVNLSAHVVQRYGRGHAFAHPSNVVSKSRPRTTTRQSFPAR